MTVAAFFRECSFLLLGLGAGVLQLAGRHRSTAKQTGGNVMSWKSLCLGSVLGLSVLLPWWGNSASAEDIGVANFGAAANGMPWAIALEKGFFKEAGVDITGVISSLGGGPDLRVVLGGNLPYAEAGLSAVAGANQAGADLVVVSTNANTVADILWVVPKNSSINSIKDLKGKKLAFSNPGS